MRIADVIGIIDQMSINEEKWDLPRGMATSLLGPRNGSDAFTTGGLEDLDRDMILSRIIVDRRIREAGAEYWCVKAPELGGRLRVVPLWLARQLGWNVYVNEFGRNGGHELVSNATDEVAEDHIVVVAGQHSGHKIVRNWHPGDVVAELNPEWNGNIHKLHDWVAVYLDPGWGS